jgi:cyclophilin family peptidyl-prolyl cis-trans isomerase
MKKIFLILFLLGCEMKFDQFKYASKQKNILVIDSDMGVIKIALFYNDAPKNVSNIIKLANEGFYNGTTFHRVVPNFVIQGGDPNSKDEDPENDGYGGPGYYIEDEISKKLKFLEGTVGMANAGPNTNGSQFFICINPQPRLDGKYTIIGQVIEGMDVVRKIEKMERDENDRPYISVRMNKVFMEVKK